MISPSLQCSYSRIFAIKYIERHLTGALSWLGGEVLHTHQVHAEGRWRTPGAPRPPRARPPPSPGVPCPPPASGCCKRAPACEMLGSLGVSTPCVPERKLRFQQQKQEHGSFLASLGSQPLLISLPGSGGWGSVLQAHALACVWVRAFVGWITHTAYACSV